MPSGERGGQTRAALLRSSGRCFAFVIGQAAPHRVVGSAAVMAAELWALIGRARNARADLLVGPLAAAASIGLHGYACSTETA
ncbi:Scr1 family TA system antitoxin-like transcriptional regulator [Nocardia violaceofusca]|uniref:Scr1 family TA system antitoxin-like transcriptional regulator n=1 Tax=Nocardia violaceofusca TaxID=941182 RepID=UPI00352DCA5F